MIKTVSLMSTARNDRELNRYAGFYYQRHRKDRDSLRGTVDILDEAGDKQLRSVPGFPSIKRVYRLKEGVSRLFGRDDFFAEEKLDGYNVRVFRHNDRLLALSRGGFICPFTSEWAEIWGEDRNLHRFFRDYPDHVLCGEVVGDNPYNNQRDPELPAGAHFYVFEIVGPDGNFFPPEERYAVVRDYKLPMVPFLGRYNQENIDSVYQKMRELNDQGREGVVLKGIKGQRRLKFVTPKTDIQDLRDALKVGFDLSSGFFFNRYLRVAIFVKELGLDQEEYAGRLGWAFLEGIPGPDGFSESSERYNIYVRNRATWDELEGQLSSRIVVKCDNIESARAADRDMLFIDFRRIYQKSSHSYKRILKGYLHKD